MHVRNWSWPLPTDCTLDKAQTCSSYLSVSCGQPQNCYLLLSDLFNPNSLQWPFVISEIVAIFVLCVTMSAQPFWVYSFEWLLMDRTDLKGYFINLAHPEVNMAHIQLREVVALYPALYYYCHPIPYSDQTHRPIPHPPLPGSAARSQPEQSIVPAFCLSACHNASHAPSNILAHSNWHKKCRIYNTHIEILVFWGKKWTHLKGHIRYTLQQRSASTSKMANSTGSHTYSY